MKPDGNIDGPWELLGYSGADYTGDNYTQKIVTGYIFIINGAAIACCSPSQNSYTICYRI